MMYKDEEREWDHDWEHWTHENPLGAGRGIMWGMMLGAALWACIVGGIWYFFYR